MRCEIVAHDDCKGYCRITRQILASCSGDWLGGESSPSWKWRVNCGRFRCSIAKQQEPQARFWYLNKAYFQRSPSHVEYSFSPQKYIVQLICRSKLHVRYIHPYSHILALKVLHSSQPRQSELYSSPSSSSYSASSTPPSSPSSYPSPLPSSSSLYSPSPSLSPPEAS